MTYKKEMEMKASMLSQETKQKILDLLHEGKSIGDVCTELELELGVVCEIVMHNIKKYEWHELNKNAV